MGIDRDFITQWYSPVQLKDFKDVLGEDYLKLSVREICDILKETLGLIVNWTLLEEFEVEGLKDNEAKEDTVIYIIYEKFMLSIGDSESNEISYLRKKLRCIKKLLKFKPVLMVNTRVYEH